MSNREIKFRIRAALFLILTASGLLTYVLTKGGTA